MDHDEENKKRQSKIPNSRPQSRNSINKPSSNFSNARPDSRANFNSLDNPSLNPMTPSTENIHFRISSREIRSSTKIPHDLKTSSHLLNKTSGDYVTDRKSLRPPTHNSNPSRLSMRPRPGAASINSIHESHLTNNPDINRSSIDHKSPFLPKSGPGPNTPTSARKAKYRRAANAEKNRSGFKAWFWWLLKFRLPQSLNECYYFVPKTLLQLILLMVLLKTLLNVFLTITFGIFETGCSVLELDSEHTNHYHPVTNVIRVDRLEQWGEYSTYIEVTWDIYCRTPEKKQCRAKIVGQMDTYCSLWGWWCTEKIFFCETINKDFNANESAVLKDLWNKIFSIENHHGEIKSMIENHPELVKDLIPKDL